MTLYESNHSETIFIWARELLKRFQIGFPYCG
jgi:hypothetical protein